MSGIPGAMVVVDPGREYNAVREANKMGLAVIGLLDTDCSTDGVDIVIPGNDDALRSVRLLVESLARSIEEGASAHRDRMASTGAAERSSDEVSGDEPRPTRGRSLKRPAKSEEASLVDSLPEAGTGSGDPEGSPEAGATENDATKEGEKDVAPSVVTD
jgi:small subunit ribosomal protein S2